MESRDNCGRAAYASSSGDTAFRRRNPYQLQSTLAFMVSKSGGAQYRLRQYEVAWLRECLALLNDNNPHVRVLFAIYERFGAFFGKLQMLIPLGCGKTQVCIQRSHRAASLCDSIELKDALGRKGSVLVVVDPSEMPRTWYRRSRKKIE